MKKLLALFLLIGFISTASAFDYDFERSSVTNTAEDSEITLTALQPDTQYTFMRGDGEQIKTFTTSATGVGSFKFDFSPIADGYGNISERGFYYEVTSPSAQDQSVFLYPGYFIKDFDTFDDGTVNNDLYENDGCGGLSESNSILTAQCGNELTDTFITLQRNITQNKEYKEIVKYRLEDTGGDYPELYDVGVKIPGHGDMIFYSKGDLFSGDQVEDFGGYKNLRVYYNESANEFVGIHGNKRKTISAVDPGNYSVKLWANSAAETGNVDVQISSKIGAVIPHKDSNNWNLTGSLGFQPTEGLLTYSLESKLLDLRGTPSLAWAGYTPNAGDSGFTFNLEEIGAWNALALTNSQNGTADYLTISVKEAEGFKNLKPADDIVLTNDTGKFSFEYNIDSNGYLRFISRVKGSNNFEVENVRYSATGKCEAGTANLVKRTTLVADKCKGERITAKFDISSIANRTYWAFQVSDYYTTRQYNSEVRSFRRLIGDSNVAAIVPKEGTTITTLKPRFIGQFNTAQEGTARLELNNNTLNSWILKKPFNGRLSFKPSVGLTEGNKTYKFIFDGVAGQTAKSQTVNFAINTSLADNLNITPVNPINGETLTTGNIDLTYEVEANSDAESTVYLDGSAVATQDIDAGSRNYSLEIKDLGARNHNWFVTVNQSNVIYQSELEQFDVRENVTIKRSRPKDEAVIEQPPVVFNGTLSTTGPGTLYISVDGDRVKSTQFPEGDLQDFEFVIDENIESGKHSYSYTFVTDLGDTFKTSSRTFTLEVGSVEDGVVANGGILRSIADKYIGQYIGTSTTVSLSILVVVMDLILSVFTVIVLASGGVEKLLLPFGIVFYTILTVSAIAGLFPVWIPVAIVIVALAYLVYPGGG